MNFVLQFVDGDAGDAQLAQKALASDKLIRNVGREDAEEKDQEPSAKRGEILPHAFDLTAKYVAEAEKRAGPQERTHGIEEKEALRTHVKDAGKGRGARPQPPNNLAHPNPPPPLLRK